MKNNTKTVSLIIMLLSSLSFTACGGGSSADGFSGNSYEEINISKACTSPDVLSEYITLKSADQIVKDEEGTNISILHDEAAVKKVCLNSGVAHINRAYTE
jgi:hypothetical protein